MLQFHLQCCGVCPKGGFERIWSHLQIHKQHAMHFQEISQSQNEEFPFALVQASFQCNKQTNCLWKMELECCANLMRLSVQLIPLECSDNVTESLGMSVQLKKCAKMKTAGLFGSHWEKACRLATWIWNWHDNWNAFLLSFIKKMKQCTLDKPLSFTFTFLPEGWD